MDLIKAIEFLDEKLSADNIDDCTEHKEEYIQLRKWLNELMLYRKLGTFSTCKTAIERQRITKLTPQQKKDCYNYVCQKCSIDYAMCEKDKCCFFTHQSIC